MLAATQKEIDHVTGYMKSQAPDLTVEFVQKVYAENVLNVRHDIWDVHTNADRWWVITEPMNLYAQEQFPNMDLVLTFHIGLCLRIPRNVRQKFSDIPVEPFAACLRILQEASEAVAQAQEVADYQAIGVRCREGLLAFVDIAQTVMPWTASADPPKKADLRAWSDHICAVVLSGDSQKQRRHYWLTHTKSSNWYDAETAVSITDNAIGLCISTVIRHLRGVPEHCPSCGSQRLSPERGYDSDSPEVTWERPTCSKCGWAGEPVPIEEVAKPHAEPRSAPPEGECIIPTTPLRQVKHPKPRTERFTISRADKNRPKERP